MHTHTYWITISTHIVFSTQLHKNRSYVYFFFTISPLQWLVCDGSTSWARIWRSTLWDHSPWIGSCPDRGVMVRLFRFRFRVMDIVRLFRFGFRLILRFRLPLRLRFIFNFRLRLRFGFRFWVRIRLALSSWRWSSVNSVVCWLQCRVCVRIKVRIQVRAFVFVFWAWFQVQVRAWFRVQVT